MEKRNGSRLSYLFSHLHLLSSNLSLLSASALPCFSSVHIVGSLTSKLPSAIHRKWKKVWSYWSAWLLDRQSRASASSRCSLGAFFFLNWLLPLECCFSLLLVDLLLQLLWDGRSEMVAGMDGWMTAPEMLPLRTVYVSHEVDSTWGWSLSRQRSHAGAGARCTHWTTSLAPLPC